MVWRYLCQSIHFWKVYSLHGAGTAADDDGGDDGDDNDDDDDDKDVDDDKNETVKMNRDKERGRERDMKVREENGEEQLFHLHPQSTPPISYHACVALWIR